jgi:general L-amino acid transport system permease protein
MSIGQAPPTRHHARVAPWRDVRVLRNVLQLAIVLAVLLVGLWLWNNLVTAMGRTNLTFGLGFLNATAGFEISESPIPYTATDTYARAFAVGLLNTLLVSVVGIILATILGVLVGIARLSSNWVLTKIVAGYVELMRNTPLLVQLVLLWAVLISLPSVANSITLPGSIFLNQRGLSIPRPVAEPHLGAWLALLALAVVLSIVALILARRREDAGRSGRSVRLVGLGVLIGLPALGWLLLGQPFQFDLPVLERFNFVGGVTLSPEFTALLVGLVIYTAAFIGEVVRGGIQAVRRGQLEAAQSLGLSDLQTLRLIVFPQALRIIIPPLTSQYLNLAKNSSLAIAIGFPDLFNVSYTMANQTGQPVSVIALVMGTYLVISLATSLLMNIYNRRVQVLER